ncbi:MAG: hypothetical protein ACOYOU_15200 [Kiritimatiellia bacterium]
MNEITDEKTDGDGSGSGAVETRTETDSGTKQRVIASNGNQVFKMKTRHLRLLEALVYDPDVQAGAVAAGVSRMTAYRWLKQPVFQEELKRQRDDALSAAMVRVKAQATRAVNELTGLLSAKDERLRRLVCTDILDRAIKVRELEDLENRLVALEKAMKTNTRTRRGR